jgi:SET domain
MEGVPLQADFVKADILLNRFWALLRRKRSSQSKPPNDEDGRHQVLAKDLWDVVRNVTQARDRLASAIPSFEDVETVLKTGTAAHSTPNRIRSLEWLAANGRCLDNMRPGDSTISQAGKGAFATRSIAAGTVVSPMPVVQILRRDLEVYEATEPFDDDENPLDPSKVRYLGMQLLLNYCYGHKDSSLLLFPYAPVVNYVNHHPDSANAELRWSTLGVHQSDWLSRAPEELASEPHAGLIMELVALRNILPGEEIFLDYGLDWSLKWSEFQRDWVPPPNGTLYVSAAMLNRRNEWLLTEQEQVKSADSRSKVYTMCYVGRKRVRVDDRSLLGDGETSSVYEWKYADGIYEDTDNLYPCQVVDRVLVDEQDLSEAVGRSQSISPVEVLYSVRVSSTEEDDEDDDEDSGDTSYYVSVPREAIVYFDRPYTSDLFLRNAFRHEIQLPDEMVPLEWRDLASQK